ncbi:MAG: hypothetical protein JST68_22615 [Bacteroidetes bacterium]|nr:hypothetical protein [Bacteroidota bacterium]
MEDLSQTFHPIKELLHPKSLKEKELMSHDKPLTLKAEQSYPLTLENITFSFGAGAAMDVLLFNDENDVDDSAFLGAKDMPIVFNTASEAYLKYANTVTAKANQQITLAQLGFDLDLSASGSAKCLYYKKHPNSQLVRDAFMEDLKHFKTIFKWEDVENLEENNGLGFLVSGSLSCNLKVSWSNILSTGISTLSSKLPVPVTLDISLLPSFTASFAVTVSDDFSYLLKKQAGGQYLISVCKKKSNNTAVTFGSSIGVQFADPTELGNQVGALCDKVIQSTLGSTITEINTAVQNFKQGKKAPIVDKLFKLFQLDKMPAPIDLLTPQLKALEKDISDAITKLATESVSMSLTYQYNRIEEKKELLSVVVAGSDLKKYHGDLLKFKMGGLLNDMRSEQVPFTLVSYLNEKVLTVTKSWGLGLTLFNFTLLTTKNYTQDKDTILTNLKGDKNQISLDRISGYKWKLIKGSGGYTAQMTAAMPEYSAVTTIDGFDFTFLLNTVLKDTSMDEKDFRAYLDRGSLWGAVNTADVDRLVDKYKDAIGKSVLVEGKLVFPPAVMRALIAQLAADGWGTNSKKQLAKAMGASMSFLAEFSLRANPQVRLDTYAPLFSSYLDTPDLEPSEYAAMVEEELQGLNDPDNLSKFEVNPANWTFDDYFAGVIRANPTLQADFVDFFTGMTDLQSRIQSRSRWSDFNISYKKLMGYQQYPFGLLAMGRLLLQYATDLNLVKDVKKVLTFTYGPDKSPTVVNCSVV